MLTSNNKPCSCVHDYLIKASTKGRIYDGKNFSCSHDNGAIYLLYNLLDTLYQSIARSVPMFFHIEVQNGNHNCTRLHLVKISKLAKL